MFPKLRETHSILVPDSQCPLLIAQLVIVPAELEAVCAEPLDTSGFEFEYSLHLFLRVVKKDPGKCYHSDLKVGISA